MYVVISIMLVIFLVQIMISLSFKKSIRKDRFYLYIILLCLELLFMMGFVLSGHLGTEIWLVKSFKYLYNIFFLILIMYYLKIINKTRNEYLVISIISLAILSFVIIFLGNMIPNEIIIIMMSFSAFSVFLLLNFWNNNYSKNIKKLIIFLVISELIRVSFDLYLTYEILYNVQVHYELAVMSFFFATLSLFIFADIYIKIGINNNLSLALDSTTATSLLNIILNEHPDALVITDLENKIVYANNQSLKITGYLEEEVIGKNPRLFSSGQTSSDTYKDLYKALKNDYTWSGEFVNKKKNGEIYFEKTKIVTIFDVNKNPIFYLALKTDISREKEYLRKVEYLSKYDDLTELYRRQEFLSLIEEKANQDLSVTRFFGIFDLDGFKTINDKYGHSVGDEALILFANILKDVFNSNSYLCRFGGDEFAVFIYDKTIKEVNELLEDLYNRLKLEPLKLENDEIYLKASMGITLIDGQYDFRTTYDISDKYLYEVKNDKSTNIRKDF